MDLVSTYAVDYYLYPENYHQPCIISLNIIKYKNIFYACYRINNSLHPLPPPAYQPRLYPALPNPLINYGNSYCTRVCFHFHVIVDDSMVYNSYTHILRGVNINILPNLYCCTVNI